MNLKRERKGITTGAICTLPDHVYSIYLVQATCQQKNKNKNETDFNLLNKKNTNTMKNVNMLN